VIASARPESSLTIAETPAQRRCASLGTAQPTGITFVAYENPSGVTTNEQRVQNFLDSDRLPG
jgi:hypothetical protein